MIRMLILSGQCIILKTPAQWGRHNGLPIPIYPFDCTVSEA